METVLAKPAIKVIAVILMRKLSGKSRVTTAKNGIVERGGDRSTKAGPNDERHREAISLRPQGQHAPAEDATANLGC